MSTFDWDWLLILTFFLGNCVITLKYCLGLICIFFFFSETISDVVPQPLCLHPFCGAPGAECLGWFQQIEFSECAHCTLARELSMLMLLGEAVWREGCGNTSEWNKERAVGRQKNVDVVIRSSICKLKNTYSFVRFIEKSSSLEFPKTVSR